MSDVKTVATKVSPEAEEKLQTVVDSEGVSKSEYVRSALLDRVNSDYDGLTDEDRIVAKVADVERSIDADEAADSETDESGIKSPFEVVRFLSP